MGRTAAIQILSTSIKDMKIANLTTLGRDGTPSSRPVITQTTEFDEILFFFRLKYLGNVNKVIARANKFWIG